MRYMSTDTQNPRTRQFLCRFDQSAFLRSTPMFMTTNVQVRAASTALVRAGGQNLHSCGIYCAVCVALSTYIANNEYGSSVSFP